MMNKGVEGLIEYDNHTVRTMSDEIKYICNECVEHNDSFKMFKERLLSRIEIEDNFYNSLKPK